MAIVINTFFWSIFFMFGFIAIFNILEEVGSIVIQNYFHRKIETVVLLMIYSVLILLLVRWLRAADLTFSWTANAIRLGILVYTALRLSNVYALISFIGLSVLSFWPMWNFRPLGILNACFMLTFMLIINRFNLPIRANHNYYFLVTGGISLIWWIFNYFLYSDATNQILPLTITSSITMMAIFLYTRLLNYHSEMEKQLRYDTQHDKLTGVRSLERFERDFKFHHNLSIKDDMNSCYLVVLDIDHFKQINDTYGHPVGNNVLIQFSHHLDQYLNTLNVPCGFYRTGGEEFSIIIAGHSDDKIAYSILNHYHDLLKDLTIQHHGKQITISISAGLTQVTMSDNIESAVNRADELLYQAKRAGRDRIMTDIRID